MTIEVFARARGMTVLQIFIEAHKMYGTMYGLQSPKALYQLWLNGWCVLPLYVHRWIRYRLNQEDAAEQPLLPFV